MSDNMYVKDADGQEHLIRFIEKDGAKYLAVALTSGSDIVGTVRPELITVDGDLVQTITVVTSGSLIQGPNVSNPSGWMAKADPDNTDTVWIIPHGYTKTLKGFPLNVGEAIPLQVSNLNSLDFDADANGNKIRLIKL